MYQHKTKHSQCYRCLYIVQAWLLLRFSVSLTLIFEYDCNVIYLRRCTYVWNDGNMKKWWINCHTYNFCLFSQNHEGCDIRLDEKMTQIFLVNMLVVFFFFPMKYKCIVYRNVWGSETVNRRRKDKEKQRFTQK